MIITIDPGHGGTDPGAVGVTGLFEKDVVLDIARRVKTLASFDARLLRSTDIFIPLRRRVAVRNSVAFVSLHCNAHTTAGANGTETFFHSANPISRVLADIVQADLVKNLGRRNRGVKTPPGRGFAVLNVNRSVPSVLIEFAFISNPEEEALLRSDSFRQRCAESVVESVSEFLKYR